MSSSYQDLANQAGRFFWLIDHGRAAEVVEFFAPEGIFEFGERAPNAGRFSGEELKTFFEARQANKTMFTRHVISNFVFSESEEGELSATFLMTVYRCAGPGQAPEVMFVSDVADRYQRCDGEWKIAHRLIDPVVVMQYRQSR